MHIIGYYSPKNDGFCMEIDMDKILAVKNTTVMTKISKIQIPDSYDVIIIWENP